MAPATIRRYDDLDPKLEKLPGFAGFFLIEAGEGIVSSLSLFETPEQGMESTKIVATWNRDEKLETIVPNEPKITSGPGRRAQRPRPSRVTRPHRGSVLLCRADGR